MFTVHGTRLVSKTWRGIMSESKPIFQNPELQNILSQLDKLSKAELNLVQFIIQGLIEERPKLTPEEVAEINEKNQKAVDEFFTTTIERITGGV